MTELLLLDLVKEKGVVDMIMEYKKEIEIGCRVNRILKEIGEKNIKGYEIIDGKTRINLMYEEIDPIQINSGKTIHKIRWWFCNNPYGEIFLLVKYKGVFSPKVGYDISQDNMCYFSQISQDKFYFDDFERRIIYNRNFCDMFKRKFDKYTERGRNIVIFPDDYRIIIDETVFYFNNVIDLLDFYN